MSQPAEVAPRRVLLFGDSLVAGVGDPAGGGWVARMASACFAHGCALTVYNLGVRRETSLQIASRWCAEAAARLPPDADARMVVSFGANDTTIEHGSLRVPPATSQQALAKIVEEAKRQRLPLLVIGPAPVDDEDQNHRIAALSATFAETCSEHSIPFIGVADELSESDLWMSEVSASDGAHPEARGYDELTQLLIARGLLGWLTA